MNPKINCMDISANAIKKGRKTAILVFTHRDDKNEDVTIVRNYYATPSSAVRVFRAIMRLEEVRLSKG